MIGLTPKNKQKHNKTKSPSRITKMIASVHTVDFFRSFIKDPYVFGAHGVTIAQCMVGGDLAKDIRIFYKRTKKIYGMNRGNHFSNTRRTFCFIMFLFVFWC
jgi:hypothetical protein